jgi:hypothetical protein
VDPLRAFIGPKGQEAMIDKTIRIGTTGSRVKQLQSLLNTLSPGGTPVSVDGVFGAQTERAVRDFQKRNGSEANGIVGPETWKILLGHRESSRVLFDYRLGPQEPLASIAARYIGATEAKGNRIGSDPRMREIFSADNLADKRGTDGYAWCAAFVSLCVQRLVTHNPLFYSVVAPREASVNSFHTRWALAQRCLAFKSGDRTFFPHRGDIIVYIFSHIGIVENVAGNSLQTIEGNTNAAGSREGTTCMRKMRAIGLARCFIRLPVAMTVDDCPARYLA